MEIFPGLRLSNFINPEMSRKFQEKTLHDYMTSLLGGPNEALIGDIGQRIATLLRYQIGPKWISGNLAAIYWRHFGKTKEAITCLKHALSDGKFEDLAMVQLAQLTIRLGPEYLPKAKSMVQKAIKADPTEPVPHYLMGYLNFLANSLFEAKKEFTKTLEIEPAFEDAEIGLAGIGCLQKSGTFRDIKTRYQPICCWPAEQNAYCFGNNETQRCFRVAIKDNNVTKLEFEYVRCSGKYTVSWWLQSDISGFPGQPGTTAPQ